MPVAAGSLAGAQVFGGLEYSRNLLFRSGAQMDTVFGRLVDRTRGRLDVPKLRTLFGAKHRPHKDRTSTSRIEAVIETPAMT